MESLSLQVTCNRIHLMALPNHLPPILARILGIKLQYRNPTGEERVTRGESVFSVSTADTFVEQEPTVLEWISQIAPSRRTFVDWSLHLFPFLQWIDRYNARWLLGDLVAGKPSLP